MWTHRVVAFGEVGKIGRSDLKEFQQGLFRENNNFVEEWGPAYAGRFKAFWRVQKTFLLSKFMTSSQMIRSHFKKRMINLW